MATELKDLDTRQCPNWCPGCGDFGIHMALKQALVKLELPPEDVAISTGIGCGSKINQWIETYGFAGLHGRSIPVAMGIKLANPDLTVVDVSGDGDGYGIGMCHFINTMRRNLDITYIVQDNQVYGLTLGQTSPTSDKGSKGPSTPEGVIEDPVNPIRLALSSDATFVARGFAGDIPHLVGLIEEGIKHKGFSLIEILQPCIIWNKERSYEWYRKKVYSLKDEGYIADDRREALVKAKEEDKLAIGIFYQEEKKAYHEEVSSLTNEPLVRQSIEKINIGKLLEDFRYFFLISNF